MWLGSLSAFGSNEACLNWWREEGNLGKKNTDKINNFFNKKNVAQGEFIMLSLSFTAYMLPVSLKWGKPSSLTTPHSV